MNYSLLYEILLYLNSFYFGMFAVCENGVGIYKTTSSKGSAVEFTVIFFLCVVEGLRIYLGRKGSLNEKALPVVISVLLTIPTGVGVVCCLFYQENVLRLEIILCSIQGVLHVSEFFVGIVSLLPVYRPTKV